MEKRTIHTNHTYEMDTTDLKSLFKNEIELLTALQERISTNGVALDTTQKRIIRNLIANNRLHEMFKDIEMFFRQESVEDLNNVLEYINGMMQQFS